MSLTLIFLAAACWAFLDSRSSYELQVRGAVVVTAHGGVEAGPSGSPAERYYTITLGGPDGAAALVFTRAGSAYPPVGEYRVGEHEIGRAGFSGLLISGMPVHPTGVFWVQSGTVTITTASPERLTGRFELRAVGFLTESPAKYEAVTATGSFAVGTSALDSHRALNRARRR